MPILKKIEEKRTDIKIVKIDVDLYQDLVFTNNIKSFPTLILYKKGKEINRQIGYCSFEKLLNFIDQK